MERPEVADEKTRADLGWDALLGELAARCHTLRGQAIARAVGPAADAGAARARAEEAREARALADGGEAMGFGGVSDVASHLDRAEKGGYLDGPPLREIAATLTAGARLRRHLAARIERAPRLCGRAALIAPLEDLSGPIDDSFDDAGRLRDTASPALAGLRRRAADLHEELARRSKALLEHPSIAPHLQDHFYTQREDRYVVPIRADARTRVKGIVHDISGSGQTVFVEPEEVVDLNNRLKLAELEVADEERRILGELTLMVTDAAPRVRANLEILAALDFADGSARLSADLAATECALTEGGDGEAIDLRNARHPLMVLAGRPCVPNDLVIGRGRTLVVTGPNAGGKTVALKTTGLLALMARAGLHVPAQEGSHLPRFDRVLTDVGDDQSLERNLSTFSAHVGHLQRFLAAAAPRTLVLLDEVAVGTDPDEGAALGQAVLEALAARGATAIVTTHYDRLKALGARDPRFANASVGFDLAKLEPTYKLQLGVPGASGAIVVARRLGLDGQVADRARELAGAGASGLEELLGQVEAERRRLEGERAAAEVERRTAEAARREMERRAAEAKVRLADARRGAHDEAVEALSRARAEIDRLRAQAKRAASPEELKQAKRAVDQAAKQLHAHAPAAAAPDGRAPTAAELKPGVEVIVPRLGGRGLVTAAPSGGRVSVQVGALKMSVGLDELLLPERPGPRPPAPRAMRPDDELTRAARAMAPAEASARTTMRSAGNTCDLRGERVDAACAIAEKFLDDALRAGQEAVFFVHGHGTGALRSALRERLKESPVVAEVRPGTIAEGGDGVTVALLA